MLKPSVGETPEIWKPRNTAMSTLGLGTEEVHIDCSNIFFYKIENYTWFGVSNDINGNVIHLDMRTNCTYKKAQI